MLHVFNRTLLHTPQYIWAQYMHGRRKQGARNECGGGGGGARNLTLTHETHAVSASTWRRGIKTFFPSFRSTQTIPRAWYFKTDFKISFFFVARATFLLFKLNSLVFSILTRKINSEKCPVHMLCQPWKII